MISWVVNRSGLATRSAARILNRCAVVFSAIPKWAFAGIIDCFQEPALPLGRSIRSIHNEESRVKNVTTRNEW